MESLFSGRLHLITIYLLCFVSSSFCFFFGGGGKGGGWFHWRRNRSRSRKSASDLVKIESRSRKLGGIGVGRIRTVSFSSDSAYDSDDYDPMKTSLSELQAEVLGLFFGFHLRLRQSSFHWIISVAVISGIGRKV